MNLWKFLLHERLEIFLDRTFPQHKSYELFDFCSVDNGHIKGVVSLLSRKKSDENQEPFNRSSNLGLQRSN